MTGFKPGKYLKHSPRCRLGAIVGAGSGVLTYVLLESFWIGVFAGGAFGALAAFGAIGTGRRGFESWADAGDPDGGAD